MEKESIYRVDPSICRFWILSNKCACPKSGGRYTVPVNWVGILYFGIGMIHISSWLLIFILSKKPTSEVIDPHQHCPCGEIVSFHKNEFINIHIFVGIW